MVAHLLVLVARFKCADDHHISSEPYPNWRRVSLLRELGRDHGDPSTGRGPKYASVHDLRRSCRQRLEDAGVPPTLIARVMRHQSWDTTRKHYVPGDVQKDATKLKKLLEAPTAKPDNGKTGQQQ